VSLSQLCCYNENPEDAEPPNEQVAADAWTRRGADLLLQVRCAVYNGTFGSAFGQKFTPANDTHLTLAAAA